MTDTSETLVILSPAFPSDESETHWVPSQQLLVKSLKEQFPNMEVIVLAFLYPRRRATFRWHGVRVISFGAMEKRKLSRLGLWFMVWNMLRKINREQRIGGIFSFWCGECALIGKYFGIWYEIRHYSWICGQDARPGNRMVRYIRPNPETLVSMSPFLTTEFFKSHGIMPAHLIPNAVDPVIFPAPPTGGREIDILGVGSLTSLKRYDVFVEVVHALYLQLPGLRALHCGDGPEKARLESLIIGKRLQQSLTLSGVRTHEEVLQEMSRARILLHTSSYEGYSTVCLEALHAGMHVISFCDPTGTYIPHWHLVRNAEEMYRCALELLGRRGLDHVPVTVHRMEDSAQAVRDLFFTTPPIREMRRKDNRNGSC